MTDRLSAWLAGLALGLGLCAAVGLAVTLGGWALPPVAYLCLFGVGLGPWVVFDHGLWLADAWRKATVESGVAVGSRFHDLRRSFFVAARRAGVDVTTIKLITGHKSSASDIYDVATEADVVGALAKLEGR